jgi:hypothetical protein
MINEISAGGNSDWVEIKASEDVSSIEIQGYLSPCIMAEMKRLLIQLSLLEGEIYRNFYDDRFAVIHFSSSEETDETDAAGDINGNGVRVLYCNNYGL